MLTMEKGIVLQETSQPTNENKNFSFVTRTNSANSAMYIVLTRHDSNIICTEQENISWIDIKSLPNEPYIVLQPICIKIKHVGENGFLASFEEANLAMSGETKEEALQNIIAEILDTFELFINEASRLGPEPSCQLRVLRKYLKPYNANFDI